MPKDDPSVAGAQGADGLHILELSHDEHLPANDEVATATAAAIAAGLDVFETATRELTTARNAQAIAGGKLEAAEDAWETQMEKTYGALVSELGRAAAERFFPKAKTKKKGAPAPPEGAPDGSG